MSGFRVNTEMWNFSDEKQLIGIYGEQSANGIEKLGMITLDLKC